MASFGAKLSGGVKSGINSGGQVLNDVASGEWGDAGNDISKEAKSQQKIWGLGGTPKLPSLGKPIGSLPAVISPMPVIAPSMPANFGPSHVQGAPGGFNGAQIGALPSAPIGANIAVNGGVGSMAGYQNQLASQLAARAAGQGPSIVDTQAAQQRQQNQAAIMAQLASARGGANPLAARTAMMANVQGNAQLDRDTMMAKIAEQQQAQQLLGQVSGQGRASDIQQATSQAQLHQEAALTQYKGQLDRAISQGQLDQRTAESMFGEAQQNARLNAQMGQAFNDSRTKYLQMGLDADKANQMAALEVEKLRQSGALAQMNANAQANAATKQMAGGALSGIAGLAGTAVGAYFGGPAGAAAGGTAAQQLANQYGNDSADVNQNYAYNDPSTGKVYDTSTLDMSNTGGAKRAEQKQAGGF